MKFTTIIQAIYDKAFSSLQIKGYFPRPYHIQCSVTQGCPMSMLLFALVLNLLICLFERHLTGIRIGHWIKITPVIAYAIMSRFYHQQTFKLSRTSHFLKKGQLLFI